MKNVFLLVSSILLAFLLTSCNKHVKNTFQVDEVSPWCIIGFDTEDRSPEQRIEMVKKMGFTKYGFNKGKGDLTKMEQEFQLAKENNIEITSIFLWLNAKRDSIGKLSPTNQKLLHKLGNTGAQPVIWVSFSDNFFEHIDHEESIQQSIKMINYVKKEADKLGCQVALYNHHGWFGNPYNQLEIIETINDQSISMVYNFHHAQDYVDDFEDIAKKMTPHLSFVNLNGVKKEGPQIITIGEGDHELEMVKLLIKEGYNGAWGILGHIKTEDVEQVLKRNVKGLNKLNDQLK